MFGGSPSGSWWSFVRFDEERDRPQISRGLLRRVGQYARPYRHAIILMLGAILLGSLLGLLPPLLLRDLIDHALPHAGSQGNLTRLSLLAGGMIILPLLTGLLDVFQRKHSSQVGEGLICDLRGALYDHMQRMGLRFFTNTKAGELISRLNNDVIGAQRAVTGTLVSIITNIVLLCITLAIMISLEWRLTILAVLILPLFILPARRIGRTLRDITRQQLEANSAMNAMMNETLNVSGALLVKLFGQRQPEVDKFTNRARIVRDRGVDQAVLFRWFFLGIGLASAIGSALVFWVGGSLAIHGGLSVGTLVAFTAYLTQLYNPISALTNARVDLATSLVSFERVFEVLDLPIEIREPANPVVLEQVSGQVRFDHVSFSYFEIPAEAAIALSARDRPPSPLPVDDGAQANGSIPLVHVPPRYWALEDVSFVVEPGQMAALVGPSGSGKTTITYLLPRLYDVTRGQIMIDGHDVRDLPLDTLAHEIGMVTQETYLFHDTIAANLRYARSEASDAELEAACQAANIHDLIMQLPEGYATVVGERGYRLSGGEKQRLSLARVILKDPRILVLDEATSSLDSNSERAIQIAMETVMRGRTTLVIAHRLSTILQADTILVLEHGVLREQGTHEVLLAAGGLYAELYTTQFAGDEQKTNAEVGAERT
ncbi:MAG: ABC transporter ATP-binding protein [Herpetosiphonaceae bacterium]|nr:ABC transporter ATP-binding protein [Herpetosiphonaceae bacterium]